MARIDCIRLDLIDAYRDWEIDRHWHHMAPCCWWSNPRDKHGHPTQTLTDKSHKRWWLSIVSNPGKLLCHSWTPKRIRVGWWFQFPLFFDASKSTSSFNTSKKEKERQSQISFTSHPLHCPYQVSECSSIPPVSSGNIPQLPHRTRWGFALPGEAGHGSWLVWSQGKKRWEKIDGVVRKLT